MNTEKIWAKFQQCQTALNYSLVEREEEVLLSLISILAKRNILLVGPPGTAKSVLATSLTNWIKGSKSLTIHCSKDTSREVAFGPLKLSALKQDKTDRNLEGGAADVELLILEEVFKSGPAVLDMFLMVMNERIYREGLVQRNTPVQFIMGVSNEWSPEGAEATLSAFFDRFLIRKSVRPIQSKKGLEKLLDGSDHVPKFTSTITTEEINIASLEANKINYSKDAKELFFKIKEELNKEGIFPGDRRLLQSYNCVKCYAYLEDECEVIPEHLEVLKHMLWDDPVEQPKKAANIIGKLTNPTGTLINDYVAQAYEVVKNSLPQDSVPKLKDIQQKINNLPYHKNKENALAYVSDEIKSAFRRVVDV